MPLIPDGNNPKKVLLTGPFHENDGTAGVFKPELTKDEYRTLKAALKDNKIELSIRSTPLLVHMVSKGDPVFLVHIDDWKKEKLLKREDIPVEKTMILRWLAGDLDAKNTFVLNRCEIRVDGYEHLILKDRK